MRRIVRLVAWGLGLAAWVPALVLAQVADQGPTSGFVPVTNIGRETLPALPLVYAAYAFVWAALVAYVFLLWRRIGRVERELADVTAKLASRR